MASWRQNKVVGIVAGVILVIAIIFVVSAIAKRAKPMPKVEIDTTQQIPGPGIMK
jgi:cell division protein FtsN